MRYAYGVTTALLVGGAAVTLATGYPAGAQVAQNDDSALSRMVPRAGAPGSFADLTEQLQPAVVNISTTQRVSVPNNPFAGTPFADLFGRRGQGEGQTRQASSLGSGFLISADGYIVTNNHVINPPSGNAELESVTVTMVDGTEYEAEVVGSDTASDLAVLKINRPEAFSFVQFGDSTQARVGDWVIAIGNPFGLGSTVTSGIVSAVYRNIGSGAYGRYIQTDAAINRGNSGGPMFDLNGDVIGINNAIYSPSGGSVGIGFAIPAEIAAPIVERLRDGKTIERGYLGVRISQIDDVLAESLGVAENRGEFIQGVEPGGAAAKAGIQAGDVILRIDGKEVTPEQTLSFIVANVTPGSRIPVELVRRRERQTVNVTVAARPTDEELTAQGFGQSQEEEEDGLNQAPQRQGAGMIEDSLGVSVLPMTGQIARQLGLPSNTGGLVISVVDPRSDAGQRGLRRRDVILSADQREVDTVEDLEAIIEEFQEAGRGSILLEVQRPGAPPRFAAIRLR